MQQLASTLKRVETFYNSIGGLLGYHRKCLQIMLEHSDQQASTEHHTADSQEEVTFHMPRGPDLAARNGRQLAAESAAAGLEALPHMAEIYPLGGDDPLPPPASNPQPCLPARLQAQSLILLKSLQTSCCPSFVIMMSLFCSGLLPVFPLLPAMPRLAWLS